MQINKYKKIGKNKYKIFFDNTDIILYEDLILKYDLLLKKDINLDILDKLILENSEYDAYEIALNYIEVRIRNKKEIKEYLEKKGFNNKLIDKTIDKLNKINLLNDQKYIEAYINDKILLSLDGPYKIKKNLLNLDMNENDIDSYLNKIDNEIWNEKVDKIINKKKTSMKNKSYYMFITKLKNDLYNMGYDNELINNKLENIEYNSDALEHDIQKYKKRYNDKNKIITSLLRKGYSYEEIITKI